MRTYNTTGIVLKRYDYRENDRLFVLFTPTHGKIEVIAKGTKKILSKLNPHLEPLTEVKVMVAKGRGFDKMANAFVISPYSRLKNSSDLPLGASIMYMMELTDRVLITESVEPEIFSLLKGVLNNWEAQIEIGKPSGYYYFMANLYALKLLDQLGYRPELSRCGECQKGILFPKSTYVFNKGSLVCESCKSITIFHDHYDISDSVIKIMQNTFDSDYSGLIVRNYHPEEMKEMNGIISRLVEYQLEKPLNSLTFLREVIK